MKIKYLVVLIVVLSSQVLASESKAARQAAQYLVRNGTQKYLGFKIGEKAFRTCEGAEMKLTDIDKIQDAPGHDCETKPTPVHATALVVKVDTTNGQIVVSLKGFENTLILPKDPKVVDALKERENRNVTVPVMAVGGIPESVAVNEFSRLE